MSAKKIITKQAILDAAFEIVRKEGMSALNMRSLALKCKCSTQPIYLSFANADEIKKEIGNMACDTFNKFIEKRIALNKFPEYKSIGMGYIEFAIDETELFKYLFMRNRQVENDFEKESFDKSTFIIMKNYGLYKDDAYKLHAEMWIFVHGIATMFATGYLDWDMETVSMMVSEVYTSLLKKIKAGGNNDN